MSVKPVRLKIRSEWFGMAPKGAGLTMRDWVEIADIVRRKKIRKTDYEKVKGVMNEYLHDK
jgi:hypothetical protein|tara:strand:+ start:3338 stop:3520 length:183 start_codon:yes stop_codon:yes gene_type:complete